MTAHYKTRQNPPSMVKSNPCKRSHIPKHDQNTTKALPKHDKSTTKAGQHGITQSLHKKRLVFLQGFGEWGPKRCFSKKMTILAEILPVFSARIESGAMGLSCWRGNIIFAVSRQTL